MKIFISLSAKDKDVSKYEWYRFTGTRMVKLYNNHKSFDCEIEKDDVFGVRPARGFIGMIHESDLSVEFRLTDKEFAAIMKRSRGYRGKVNKQTVKVGTRGEDAKAIIKPPKTTGGSVPTAASMQGQVSAGLRENKMLTTAINDCGFNLGIKKAKFLRGERAFGREVYYYYDVTNALNSYRRAKKFPLGERGAFDEELAKHVEDYTQGDVDAEVGMINYMGKMTPVLACLVLEDE